MVPGGATGIVQGPDTDLHAWMEQEMISLQILSTHAKLLARPGKVPTESRQDMVDFGCTVWEACDHSKGENSFKRNGLANDLSGTEDHLISREAKVLQPSS
jgi:hemerythrin-like domain-containing protein